MQQGQKAWHAMSAAEALEYWCVDAHRGLSNDEVERRRAHLGTNSLPEAPRPKAIKQLLGQLTDPLVGALLVAALVSLGVALGEAEQSWLTRFSDSLAILLIVVVNALIGFFQERRAEAALDALAKMAAPNAKVVRDGAVLVLPAEALVPGDLVELEAGDSIPADLRLLSTHELQVEEAALTGESTPVTKRTDAILDEDAALGDRETMAYLGTTVSRGRGRAVCVATGPHTELGRIGTLIRAAERQPTPLQARLGRLGTVILVLCVSISALLFVVGIIQGERPWTVLLLTAVSLAVAAIPEGLPAITTITLALGMQRMAQRGAIVRKLPAVETLGSATLICSDKTGTLTQNAMTVRAVATAESSFRVSGEGYAPEGQLFEGDVPVKEPSPLLVELARTAVLCSNARIEETPTGLRIVGDPTEAALITFAAKVGVTRSAALEEHSIERELPFDSDRKRMSVVARRKHDGVRIAYVKGSPDVLVPLCDRILTSHGIVPLDESDRMLLLTRNEAYAKRALRVLALAFRPDPDDDPEQQLVFVGFAALIDPPRPEVKQAVAECQKAGIRVAMITGDHRLTAIAIARELGFWDDETSLAVTGPELDQMDEQRLLDRIDRVAVFARVTAEQKLLLVRAFNRRGHVVAMTGDGVNDAPALREAQIGVAMGKGGTDVAREAAAMVLADDNFATIVEAVREGRAIFRNIQKFIFFLNSSNAGLVIAVIVGSFFAWPQLTPLQLLWVNLVTNGMPALALGMDPPEPGQMEQPPRSPKQGIVGLADLVGILLVGLVMGGAALSVMLLPEHAPELLGGSSHADNLTRARAMAFTVLAFSPLFHVWSCRSRTRSAFASPFTNRALWGAVAVSVGVHLVTLLVPPLYPVFHTHALSGTEWAVVIALAALPLPLFEAIKLVRAAQRRLQHA